MGRDTGGRENRKHVGSPGFETAREKEPERKSPAKSEHKPKRRGLPQADGRRYLQAARLVQAPRHSLELSEPRSETPYEGILEDPPGCRDPTRGQIQCRGWGLWRVAGSRRAADPPARK